MRDAIVKEIEHAYAGVTLDGGVSLNQAVHIDNYMQRISELEFRALPESEVTHDWAMIPNDVLEDFNNVAFLDAKGFKYYIPALMLAILENYEVESTAGTILALYPKTKDGEFRYSELSVPQLRAIARYVRELPKLVEIYGPDRTILERAYRNYWIKYLED